MTDMSSSLMVVPIGGIEFLLGPGHPVPGASVEVVGGDCHL
jgi:hypothetical protein